MWDRINQEINPLVNEDIDNKGLLSLANTETPKNYTILTIPIGRTIGKTTKFRTGQ